MAVPEEIPNINQNIKVGDVVKFGSYYQNYSQKKEPIEWIVLERPLDDQALLISKYALDCKSYDDLDRPYDDVTWKNCTLRKWCNGYFIENAFNEKEKQLIVESENINYLGNKTKDKVFLLRTEEAREYFSSSNDRQCYPTKFTITNGAYHDGNRPCSWWLRSQSFHGNNPYFVDTDGDIGTLGIGRGHPAVRPAILLNLS